MYGKFRLSDFNVAEVVLCPIWHNFALKCCKARKYTCNITEHISLGQLSIKSYYDVVPPAGVV